MATKENFTAGRVAGYQCESGKEQAIYRDAKTPGLALRVTAAGAKSYIFETKLNGKNIRLTIGDVRTWTVGDAQAEATRLKALTDQGTDPRDIAHEKAEAKAAAKAAIETAKRVAEERQHYTLRALCDAYTATLEAQGKDRSAAATRSSFKCHVFEAHPKIASLPANEVTALQVAAMVRKVREAGKERAAGILRSYLSAAFNAAKRAPFDSALPADLIPFNIASNPVDAIPAIPVKAGSRVLSADELRAYMAALGNDMADKALLLALLAGGQRMAQLLRAKVGDYDETHQTLRLWDGKGKRQSAREHLLPLAGRAAALVAELIACAKAKESPWLFSTHGKVAMAQETPGKRVVEICAAMGGESFDLRDIRRSCETMQAKMGISKDIRAQLLSHGISGVQAAHYDRHDYLNEKRAVLVAWEAKLEEIQTGTSTSNVIQLRA